MRILIIILIVLLLFTTNPDKEDYITWSVKDLNGLEHFAIKQVLKISTKTKNYKFFSIFTSGERIAIGFLGTFIIIKNPPIEEHSIRGLLYL